MRTFEEIKNPHCVNSADFVKLVEKRRIELPTSAMRTLRSPS